MTTPSLDRSDNVSGVASVVQGILDGFATSDWVVRPVTIGKKDRTRRGLAWAMAQLGVPAQFARALREMRPQLVHVNGPLSSLAIPRDAVLLWLASRHTRNLVYHLHGGDYVSRKPNAVLHMMVRFMLSRPAAILVLGPQEADQLVRIYGACRERIHVLPNAVALPPHASERDRAGPLKILSIGRLSPEKGLAVLCEAVEQTPELAGRVTLRMFGAGPEQDMIVPRLERALGPAFHFGGVAGTAARDAAYAWADVVVMPSLRGEGLPMVLLESMAAGVVPIATVDGMIPNLVDDGTVGFLVEKGSPQSLAKGIERARAAKADGRLQAMSKTARDRIARDHSQAAYVQQLAQIYAGLAA